MGRTNGQETFLKKFSNREIHNLQDLLGCLPESELIDLCERFNLDSSGNTSSMIERMVNNPVDWDMLGLFLGKEDLKIIAQKLNIPVGSSSKSELIEKIVYGKFQHILRPPPGIGDEDGDVEFEDLEAIEDRMQALESRLKRLEDSTRPKPDRVKMPVPISNFITYLGMAKIYQKDFSALGQHLDKQKISTLLIQNLHWFLLPYSRDSIIKLAIEAFGSYLLPDQNTREDLFNIFGYPATLLMYFQLPEVISEFIQELMFDKDHQQLDDQNSFFDLLTQYLFIQNHYYNVKFYWKGSSLQEMADVIRQTLLRECDKLSIDGNLQRIQMCTEQDPPKFKSLINSYGIKGWEFSIADLGDGVECHLDIIECGKTHVPNHNLFYFMTAFTNPSITSWSSCHSTVKEKVSRIIDSIARIPSATSITFYDLPKP